MFSSRIYKDEDLNPHGDWHFDIIDSEGEVLSGAQGFETQDEAVEARDEEVEGMQHMHNLPTAQDSGMVDYVDTLCVPRKGLLGNIEIYEHA